MCHCQKPADKNCDVTERHTASHFPHIPSSQFGHFVTKKFYDVTGRHITSHFPHIPSSQFGHFVTICDFDMLLQILIVNIKKYFFITCLTILERIMSEKVHSRVRQANVTLWRRCDGRIVDGDSTCITARSASVCGHLNVLIYVRMNSALILLSCSKDTFKIWI